MPELLATDGPAPDATTTLRLRDVLRRRAAFVLIPTVLAVIVAWAVSQTLSPAHVAESVIVVRVGQGADANPDQASRLAQTFAALIPVDTAIDHELDRQLGRDRGDFTVDNDPNTSLLRIRYKAREEQTAVRGATLVAQQISRGPSADLYASGSVVVARLPKDAPTSLAGTLTAVGAGLLGGLLLGFGLALLLERLDRRVDAGRQVAALAGGVPVIGAETLNDVAIAALVHRTGADDGGLALVSGSRSSDADTAELARHFGALPCLHGDGTPAAWTACEHDASGLVVRAAAREREVRQELALLRDIGPAPAWVVFVPRGGLSATRRAGGRGSRRAAVEPASTQTPARR